MTTLLVLLTVISLYGVSIIGGRKGIFLFVLGLLIHTGYVIYRWSFLGWFPITERHDILLVMAFFVAINFFYLYKKIPLNMLLTVLPLFVIALCFFSIFQERINTIEPNMNSSWFYIYTLLFTAGYSLLIVGSIAGLFYIYKNHALYEIIQYRSILFGWLILSLSLLAGSVWFYLAYGVYWLWTAKELWTTIAWFYYGFYLHARMINSLSGKTASIVGTAGFAVIMFSYLGVMPVLGSPWTQF